MKIPADSPPCPWKTAFFTARSLPTSKAESNSCRIETAKDRQGMEGLINLRFSLKSAVDGLSRFGKGVDFTPLPSQDEHVE